MFVVANEVCPHGESDGDGDSDGDGTQTHEPRLHNAFTPSFLSKTCYAQACTPMKK
jgi:hypothetical protein